MFNFLGEAHAGTLKWIINLDDLDEVTEIYLLVHSNSAISRKIWRMIEIMEDGIRKRVKLNIY